MHSPLAASFHIVVFLLQIIDVSLHPFPASSPQYVVFSSLSPFPYSIPLGSLHIVDLFFLYFSISLPFLTAYFWLFSFFYSLSLTVTTYILSSFIPLFFLSPTLFFFYL